MPIKGKVDPPVFEPQVEQLTPEWWEMVRFAMQEARRLNLQLGMHASDGFALAGGPWITPEYSMQKVVWTEMHLNGGKQFSDTLAQPESFEGYYQDIAVYAFPSMGNHETSGTNRPRVRTSTGENADFLVMGNHQEQFRCKEDCWFEYEFEQPFTCRSIRVITKGNNYQSHRLLVQASDDGQDYRTIYQMIPPRHGWQDTDAEVTYAIPSTTARFYRFQWNKAGTEPGAEDLDAAKWSPRLKIAGLELSAKAKVHQYEGKAGAVWRISPRTTTAQLPPEACIPPESVIDLSDKMDTSGLLTWEAPVGNWTILRMGHTSTGHTNATGGGGKGLECDKFNPAAVNRQFEGWYGEILRQMGPNVSKDVLTAFHIDSWECGSQNWSPVFRQEFIRRRGYDPLLHLPVMAGYPVRSAEFSEQYLYDIRQTISELITDTFYGVMARRARENRVVFSAESVAPTMLSDGMRHYGEVDLPMGEFWLRSPTHDKPNDMLDAISGAHVYGKNIISAEGFTQLRMAWDEHPGMLKTLQDRNYALGINKLFYHVFMHNPWVDKKPGMTLDPIGLFFQRDQTWWNEGAAWVTYAERCQQLLQQGKAVVDIAVFTGEGLPRRAILPDRLVPSLPGIFGEATVRSEQERLLNHGQPQRELPTRVQHSANMADPENYLDPLRGYKYDSFNKDALLRLADVQDQSISLSTGASYQLLVLPQSRRMDPDPEYMSAEVIHKLTQLVRKGATLLIGQRPTKSPGLGDTAFDYPGATETLWGGLFETGEGGLLMKKVGLGKVMKTPYLADDFSMLGIIPDFLAFDDDDENRARDLAWTHRRTDTKDLYFVSNQQATSRELTLSLRVEGKVPELYNPVEDSRAEANSWEISNHRTILTVNLPANGSLFVILEKSTDEITHHTYGPETQKVHTLTDPWLLTFDPALGGPSSPITLDTLISWTDMTEVLTKYYAGSAWYETRFIHEIQGGEKTWLSLGTVHNIARVKVNGVDCGVTWTYPYRVDISKAVKQGTNTLEISVTNTWRNRLKGDLNIPSNEQVSHTTAPSYLVENQPLLPAGLLGPVQLVVEK